MAILNNKKNSKPKSLLSTNKVIAQNLKLLKSGIADIEQQTYFSNDNDDSYEEIKSNIEKSVDNIRSYMANGNTSSYATASNVTKLLSRLTDQRIEMDQELMKSLVAFDDPQVQQGLLNAYANSIFIRQQDEEIDNIIHYMPKLLEALKIKRNYILSADHFSKDFISFTDVVRGNKSPVFNDNMKRLFKKFGLAEYINDLAMNMSKYGEQFVYIIPYKTAFEQLFKRKPTDIRAFHESEEYKQLNALKSENIYQVIAETTGWIKDKGDVSLIESFDAEILNSYKSCENLNEESLREAFDNTKSMYGMDKAYNYNIIIDDHMFIENVVAQAGTTTVTQASIGKISLSEQFINSVEGSNQVITEASSNNVVDYIDMKIPDFLAEGKSEDIKLQKTEKSEIPVNTLNDVHVSDSDSTKINIPGAILKTLDRDKVIPCYIENICIMYIYLEVIGPNNSLRNNGFESSTNLSVPINSPIAHNYGNNVTTTKRNADRVSMDERDEVIGYLSGHIAQKITKKFVNINQDLSREIYAILKNNDLVNSPMNPMTGNIRITCIPASDIIHFKYNTNPKTHRGVSDLAYSILPATMWCWLTMNFVLGTLTRGQDRRIYYAKPSIDTNVASMMLNTIDQLKRGNYGVRQIENINNIFGILGRYTDLLMPLSLNGEQPIQIDVMKGQDIDPHQEMLDKLEEYAVNMSEINIDMISTHRQMDYAIQATMTSNTTAQMVTNRQDILSEQLGNMITMLYNYEYDENIELGVNLPEPVFLKSNNNAQIVQAVISEAQTTAAAVYPDEIVNNNADKGLEKAQFIKLFTMDRLKRHYSSAYIEELMKRAEVEAKVGTSSSKESE